MYGGLACSVATIEKLTGVDIQFAAAIRWTGVINMSDAIGGVDVCVADDISDEHTGSTDGGEHTLQGSRRCSSCASVTASATAPTSGASRTSSSS
jgi:anionic cell wall polymer biosynthesis LytR-Cps2A-Psr (LCP) family protein